MLGSNRLGFLLASAPLLLLGAVCASCSSHHADAPDASGAGDAAFASDGGPKNNVKKPTDAGHDVKTKPPVDAAPGCGLCDASGGHDTGSGSDAGHDAGHTTGHDAGHDAGHTVGPLGTHTSGVNIAVTTASGVQMRTYDITVPVTCDASHPIPLVFAFHGDGGDGAGMYGSFPIEAAATAAGGSAIFVYPNGTDNNIDPDGAARAWDLYHDPGPFPYTAGDPVPAMNDEASGNADIDFFDAMLAFFEKTYCVDPSKVFITGMSSGGYLSNQFGRWRAGVVKGTAPQSGGAPFGNHDGDMGGSMGSDWQPPNYCIGTTAKVPTLIIHGLSDGTVDSCNAIEAQSYWDLANGCTNSAGNCTTNADSCTGTSLADPPPGPTTMSSLNSLCVQSSGCGAPVVLCQVPGMGHQIWSDAPQVIWSFFSSL